MKFLVINGPNMNMLGIREPMIYGEQSYDELISFCKQVASDKKVDAVFFQSNHEGDIIDQIQKAYDEYDGIIINPAAFTHTSIAIADAIRAVGIPAVEVHLSNIEEREDYRKVNYFRDVCVRTIFGQGFEGYRVAFAALINHVQKLPDPYVIDDASYRYDAFTNGAHLHNKKTKRLPAMGWNSWNAFGTNNNEELTKAMADAIINLGLDELGYKYIILDDGCYKPERVDDRLTSEGTRFPSGFKAMSDYIHDKGLLFGMYNDIGTNLCSGAQVGTFDHEKLDAQNYAKWEIDYLKVDNCYYMWDDATFSDRERVKNVFTPNIRSIRIEGYTDGEYSKTFNAVADGILSGRGAKKDDLGDYVTHIGTFDGTGPENTPVGEQSSELVFNIDVPYEGEYSLTVTYATGHEIGVGQWLELAVGKGEDTKYFYDYLLPETAGTETFADSDPIMVHLHKGANVIRIMNHRRQENTLCSYATMLKELKEAAPDRDIVFSLCEWGKNQPQNWAYKVGDSWRILNDITFRVGFDGYAGDAAWYDDYTTSITTQYNKAVIMDEFAGLDKGWNDPDMLVIGMNGLDMNMNRTHMAMWCMLNSPLMLGLDLRNVKKGDEIYQIISNKKLIALNQDTLGVQAKRVLCQLADGSVVAQPDKEYIKARERVDVLAKPLADGRIAVSYINIADKPFEGKVNIQLEDILSAIGDKMVNKAEWANASTFCFEDLWTGKKTIENRLFDTISLEACGNATYAVAIE